jgi:putative flippase GtrA
MKRLLSHYLHSHTRLAQFLRFATVGAKISAIDAGGVYLLPWLFGINIYLARVISLTTANMVGYLLNRYFTFGGHQKGCFYRQMAGHFGVHITGGLINYGIFSGIVTLGHAHLPKGLLMTLLPLFALWVGGICGMGFNFFLSKKFVFHTRVHNANPAS